MNLVRSVDIFARKTQYENSNTDEALKKPTDCPRVTDELGNRPEKDVQDGKERLEQTNTANMTPEQDIHVKRVTSRTRKATDGAGVSLLT